MGADAEDQKPDVRASPSPPPEQITLFIRGQNNSEIKFRVKPTTNFKKVSTAWCKNQGVDPTTVRFVDDGGVRLQLDKTIEELNLEPENDPEEGWIVYVDAFLQQVGGGSCW